MDNNFIIGVDPGQNGGVAVWDCEKSQVCEIHSMFETPLDVLMFFRKFDAGSTVCYLEKVGGMPGQGGSAMFNFGCGFGHLEMALLSCNIKTVEVSPQKWQKMYSLGSRKTAGGSKEWKIKLKECAQRLFPHVWVEFGIKTKKAEMAICDALLIMNYGVKDLQTRLE